MVLFFSKSENLGSKLNVLEHKGKLSESLFIGRRPICFRGAKKKATKSMYLCLRAIYYTWASPE